jgi:hypothetical protein
MKKLIVAAVVAGTFISVPAQAQDRGGSAVLGAVSGLVVFGPVGAAAGAVVGYTAGPAIANSWGIRQPRSKVRRAARSGPVAKQQAAATVAPTPVAKTQPPPVAQTPATVASTKSPPPIQTFE